MPSLARPKFIQIASEGMAGYGWNLWALDEAGDIWFYKNNQGWKKENMERLDDNPTTA